MRFLPIIILMIIMNFPIQLNYQSMFSTVKIGNKEMNFASVFFIDEWMLP